MAGTSRIYGVPVGEHCLSRTGLKINYVFATVPKV